MMDADGATRVSELQKLEDTMKGLLLGKNNGNGAGDGGASIAVEKTTKTTKAVFPDGAKLGFVLGSRAHLQESAMSKRTWIRNILMHGFHGLVMLVVGNTIRDTQCGFKVRRRRKKPFIF